ncbi:MAG: aminotransferase class V-fold PLP-dependent enzyme [Cyclobacteriaceae bacterium]
MAEISQGKRTGTKRMLAHNLTDTILEEENLETYFRQFRRGIIGLNQEIQTPLHSSIPMLYADWTATGRCYAPIENRLMSEFMPFIANTHTEANASSSITSEAYASAKGRIKQHVNASPNDVLISYGSGMTDVVNKLQRILGLRAAEQFSSQIKLSPKDRPVVFITHMEHHSNQTSWLETICDVVVVPPDECGTVSVKNFREMIGHYHDRETKIAAVIACSNVTGIITPIHEIAKVIHQAGGYCFVDFACSAPYVHIDMHPDDPLEKLDAIYFSPHKFLGGPGASGILIFDSSIYKNSVPDVSGGGTVDWTNPWGGHKYVENIEVREDGGTPAILQTIRAALAIELKEEMGVENILNRERELTSILWKELIDLEKITILAEEHAERLGILSICFEGMHHNDVVRKLNDRYGIQARGGCSCAGTYGHYLLDVDQGMSKKITDMIDQGDDSEKPGWVRISVHPTMTNREVEFMAESVRSIAG